MLKHLPLQRPVPLGLVAGSALAFSGLTGCVVTGATLHPTTSMALDQRTTSGPTKNPGNVLISESDVLSRPYIVLGNVGAWGRSLNLLSSNPTRADVDEALRAECAKLGADAVIAVRYHSSREGLRSRGVLSAEGQAIQYKAGI